MAAAMRGNSEVNLISVRISTMASRHGLDRIVAQTTLPTNTMNILFSG